MVRARERIEQDLAALEEALAALTLEFQSTYEGYLTALGQAVRQQLILACYHLCTQAVPESFLKLSFDARQKMQQSVRRLAAASEEKLRSLVAESEAEEDEEEDDFDKDQEEQEEDEEEEEEKEEDEEDQKEKKELSAINYLFSVANYQAPTANSPESLARWQNSIEKSIAHIIKLLSRDTNRLLQQSGILPSQLPEPVLEAASQAESSGDSVAGPPNLLNLIIETDASSASRNLAETLASRALHITAVKLRLSEIEFADAGTSAWRQQIRNLSVRLNSLGRDYQKKQRELAVVEAESAWRSSWFED
jgi:flagellar biosynthesis GTPase FlhF